MEIEAPRSSCATDLNPQSFAVAFAAIIRAGPFTCSHGDFVPAGALAAIFVQRGCGQDDQRVVCPFYGNLMTRIAEDMPTFQELSLRGEPGISRQLGRRGKGSRRKKGREQEQRE